jgi:hypothetical protein
MGRKPVNNLYKKALDGRSHNGAKKGDKELRAIEKDLKGLNADTKAKQNRNAIYATNAIREVFGSETEFWVHVAEKSKDSFNHMKILTEYAFGKPSDGSSNGNSNGKLDIPIVNFFTGSPPQVENTIDITEEDNQDTEE